MLQAKCLSIAFFGEFLLIEGALRIELLNAPFEEHFKTATIGKPY